jgi:hypothetical protein
VVRPTVRAVSTSAKTSRKGVGGRPSVYRAEFCTRVIELGKQGKTLAQFALDLDVSRECLYEWARTKPEFSDALMRAKDYSQAWWEDLGQRGVLMGKEFNAAAYAKCTSARFPHDYRDNQPAPAAADMAGAVAALLQQLAKGLPG